MTLPQDLMTRALRRAALLALSVLIFGITLELVSAVYFSWTHHAFFYTWTGPSRSVEYEKQIGIPQLGQLKTEIGDYEYKNSLNLQFGYAYVPSVPITDAVPMADLALYSLPAVIKPGAEPRWFALKANNFGFMSFEDYPTPPRNDELSVCVSGGSVAMWFAIIGGDRFTGALGANLPAGLRGRKVRVINLAQPGMKQPQTLSTIAFFVAVGQKCDVAITLDGFNEVYYATRNAMFSWPTASPTIDNVGVLVKVANTRVQPSELFDLRRRILTTATRMRDAHVASLFVIAEAYERWLQSQFITAYARAASTNTGKAWPLIQVSTGLPDEATRDQHELAAEIWARATIAERGIVEGEGGVFVAALQPNQYIGVPDAVVAGGRPKAFGVPARRGYRYLVAQSGALRRAGVVFEDLSLMFLNHPEVVADDCCHFNQIGNDRLADRLASIVAKRLAVRASSAAQ